jgi:hypothetical protein
LAIDDDNPRAIFRQPDGAGLADARCGAGDDRDSAVMPTCHGRSSPSSGRGRFWLLRWAAPGLPCYSICGRRRIVTADNGRAVEETVMRFRRIVTAHDASGESVFASTETMQQDEAVHLPGFASSLVWATPPGATVPDRAGNWRSRQSSFHPKTGGARFLIVSFPPDSVIASGSFDPVAAGNEQLRMSPGVAEWFEL